MKVLKANEQQLKILNGYCNGNSMLYFTSDYIGNMVVPINVIDNPDFEPIKDQLSQLEEIDYVEFPSEDI